jgi:RNA polymerase sigma-70 factor (family 1)
MEQTTKQYRLFEKVFKENFEHLAKYAWSILKNEADAEDVVQELFVRIWNNNPSILESDQAKYYLVTATRNSCISHLRKQATRVNVEPENIPDISEVPGDENPVDLVAIAKKGISELPPQCQLIFKLSRFGKLSYQQIAEELDLSVKTVENQMGKAIKFMREYARKNAVHFAWLICWMLNF